MEFIWDRGNWSSWKYKDRGNGVGHRSPLFCWMFLPLSWGPGRFSTDCWFIESYIKMLITPACFPNSPFYRVCSFILSHGNIVWAITRVFLLELFFYDIIDICLPFISAKQSTLVKSLSSTRNFHQWVFSSKYFLSLYLVSGTKSYEFESQSFCG